MSKQLAEMAAQQAALRELAKKRAQELSEDGSGNGGQMKKVACQVGSVLSSKEMFKTTGADVNVYEVVDGEVNTLVS